MKTSSAFIHGDAHGVKHYPNMVAANAGSTHGPYQAVYHPYDYHPTQGWKVQPFASGKPFPHSEVATCRLIDKQKRYPISIRNPKIMNYHPVPHKQARGVVSSKKKIARRTNNKKTGNKKTQGSPNSNLTFGSHPVDLMDKTTFIRHLMDEINKAIPAEGLMYFPRMTNSKREINTAVRRAYKDKVAKSKLIRDIKGVINKVLNEIDPAHLLNVANRQVSYRGLVKRFISRQTRKKVDKLAVELYETADQIKQAMSKDPSHICYQCGSRIPYHKEEDSPHQYNRVKVAYANSGTKVKTVQEKTKKPENLISFDSDTTDGDIQPEFTRPGTRNLVSPILQEDHPYQTPLQEEDRLPATPLPPYPEPPGAVGRIPLDLKGSSEKRIEDHIRRNKGREAYALLSELKSLGVDVSALLDESGKLQGPSQDRNPFTGRSYYEYPPVETPSDDKKERRNRTPTQRQHTGAVPPPPDPGNGGDRGSDSTPPSSSSDDTDSSEDNSYGDVISLPPLPTEGAAHYQYWEQLNASAKKIREAQA